MNYKIQLFVLFLLCTLSVSAQDPPVNSGKLIAEGIDKYENGNYEEALKLFRKVPEYDTNGTWAMYEAALTLSALEKHDESYDLLKRLVYEFKYLNPSTFNIWGSAADDKGNPEEGLDIYRRGLKLYPMSNMLAFNASVTFIKKENTDSAYHYALRSATINPLHPGSFNVLGLADMKQGRVIPAMLNFMHGVLVALDGKGSVNCYNNLNTISSGGFDSEIKKASKPYADFGGDLKDADYLVMSRTALSSGFKKKFKLREATALQLLLVMDLLEEEHEKIPFYGPLHIRFLRQVKAAGLEEVLAYSIYIPSGHQTIMSYIKKNSKEFKMLMEIFFKNINEFRGKRDLSDYGLEGEYELSYYKNSGAPELAVATKETPEKGYATYLFGNDGRLLMNGYSKNSKWEGEVLTYDAEGLVDERRLYEKGEQVGENKFYYKDGTLRGIITVPKNMTTDTMLIDFYYPDGKTWEYQYKKIGSSFEGLNRVYFADGKLKIAVHYKNNMLNGPRVEYYENGDIRSSEMFKDGKKEGPATYYYVGGQKKSEGNYKANNYVGEWKTYFANGKLSSTSNYNDKGFYVGKGEEFYENGNLAETQEFDATGNQNGTIRLYDKNGKVHTEFTFANKKVKSCKTYDANGNVVHSSTTTGKKLEFYKNDKYHKLIEKGLIENDERVGTFIEYRAGRDTAALTPYKNGKVHGEHRKYYECGRVKEISNFSNGENDGKYTEYNINGNVSFTGYYVNGDAEGYWKYYNDNGSINEIRFFVGNQKHGKFKSFDTRGNLVEEDYYDADKKTKEIKYENGVAVDTIDLSTGRTDVEYKYGNGAVRERYTIINGYIHGKYERFYPNGQKAIEAQYVNGYTHGEYKRFYANGKPMSVVPVQLGQNHGKGVYYGYNGKIEREVNFVQGTYHGLQTIYYATGKKYRETEYTYDEMDGARTYYAPDGKIIVKLFYENSILVGYTYTDKNGELLPVIPVENGTAKITAYYASGDKSCDFNFKKSYFDGKQVAYFPGTDSPILVENWENFMQEGDQIYYDYGPNKKSEHRIEKKGNTHGVYRLYHPNGKVAFEAAYDDGEIKDYEKRYSESGALETHFIFVNGILKGVAK